MFEYNTIEEAVEALAGTRDEVPFVGRLAFPLRVHDVHGCRACAEPDELPVEIEVVGQLFARTECRILCRTLGMKGKLGTEHQEL